MSGTGAHYLQYLGVSSTAKVIQPNKIVPKTDFSRWQHTLQNRNALAGYDNKYIYRTAMYNEIGNVSMWRHVMMPKNDLKQSDIGHKKPNPIMIPPKMT